MQETCVPVFDSWPGRSPEVGNGCPLQDSCLENSMDIGSWKAVVHEVQRVRHDWVTNTFTIYSILTVSLLRNRLLILLRNKIITIKKTCNVNSYTNILNLSETWFFNTQNEIFIGKIYNWLMKLASTVVYESGSLFGR